MTITNLKHKPMADIEDQDKNTRSFDVVEPTYLKKLAQRMKTADIAEALGYSVGGIAAIAAGDTPCRKVVELAAQLVWEEKFTPKHDNKNVCAFVTGNLTLLQTIKGMAAVGGGNFTFIELPTE